MMMMMKEISRRLMKEVQGQSLNADTLCVQNSALFIRRLTFVLCCYRNFSMNKVDYTDTWDWKSPLPTVLHDSAS